MRTWHPDGPNAQVEQKKDILAHHEVLLRLDAMDLERGMFLIPVLSSRFHSDSDFNSPGSKVAGHRGYFLTGDGVDLNHALIAYGLDYLRNKEYKKIQVPYMMNKEVMGKTAQLDAFDEELYKVSPSLSVHQLSIYLFTELGNGQ